MPPDRNARIDIRQVMANMLDSDWYIARYPDVVVSDLDPIAHFEQHGAPEGRDPNRFLDSKWYAAQHKAVAAGGLDAITHYIQTGAAALLDPHPRFDAAWYVQQHPEAAANPVLYHLRIGQARGYHTARPVNIRDFLPSDIAPPNPPAGVFVDVVVPELSCLEQARRCLSPVLAGRTFPVARVIVLDHNDSEPALSSWLDELSADGEIHLIRERRKSGSAARIRRGNDAAETHDVVLLQADTRVSADTQRRRSAHARSAPRIATVSALSNTGVDIYPFGRSEAELEEVCRTVNSGRSSPVPAATGCCVYVRRDALQAIGDFDLASNALAAFCRRAVAAGWQHRLGLDTFAGRDPADPSIRCWHIC